MTNLKKVSRKTRGKMKIKTECAVLVAGGGPAGVAAALQAARGGADTLLIESQGRLGGAAVSNYVSPFMGGADSPLVEEILAANGGAEVDFQFLDLTYADLLEQASVNILLHTWAAEAQVKGSRLQTVETFSKNGRQKIKARVVIDATGDGDVAAAAGAQFEKGRTADGLMQPMTVMFVLAGAAENAFVSGSEESARQIHLPAGTWEEVILTGQAAGELPENVGVIRLYPGRGPDERIVNATQVNYVDGTKAEDLTRAELSARRQARQILDFLRRRAPGYENIRLAGMPAAVGVRETRRILGEAYLTKEDLLAGRKWPDAVVWNANFCIDIHNPDGQGQAEGPQAARVQPYDIPFGCLIPKGFDNLLTAGRCISGSHEAHASYRVQKICLATGAAAGAAAALAVQAGVSVREVDIKKLQTILASK